MVHVELEINQGLADSGVDERHLVSRQSLDEVGRGLGVEPEVCVGFVVDNSGRDIVNHRSVAAVVDDLATTLSAAGKLNWLQVVVSHDAKVEGHAPVLVEDLVRHAKELIDTWQSVGNCPLDGV